MRVILIVLVSISLLQCSFCSGQKENLCRYQFSKPCAFYNLPDTLYEVSGLTDIDSAHVGCVQDEKGIVFSYNVFKSRIESHSTFYGDGDYEGITKAGNDVYVLRSDGILFRIKDYVKGNSIVTDSFDTHIPINNNEGLCFDEKNNILLIAAKGKTKKTKTTQNLRYIYGFKLDSLMMIDTALLVIDINDIAMKLEGKKVSLPPSIKKNGVVKEGNLKFKPSSIAIHPINDRLYILSAADNLLLVFSRNGKIEDVNLLPSKLFPKPEGLTFLPNGDMFIANEGKGGNANLMRFCYDLD